MTDWIDINAFAEKRGLVVLDPDATELEGPKLRAEWPTLEALTDQGGSFIFKMFGDSEIDLSKAQMRKEVNSRIEGMKRIESEVWARPPNGQCDAFDDIAERIVEIDARAAEYFSKALDASDGADEAPKAEKPKLDEAPKLDDETELECFNVGDEDFNLPPRQWLLGSSFCRTYLSGLVSAGAAGKTTFRILQALSLAIGRPLSGEYIHVRCRVMIVCLEDDLTELRRRVAVALIHYGIKPEEARDYLILTTPRGLKIAELNSKGAVEDGKLLSAIAKAVDKWKLDLVCIDPAIKAHSLDEKSNPQMDAFATRLTHLAQSKNIAIDLLSHERKGGGAEAGDANRQRGAGSQKDAARLNYTLTGMSKEDAGTLGVREDDRKNYFRIDSAKVNIAAPDASTRWFKHVGVSLGNWTAVYPNGDTVQTCEVYTPPALFDGMTGEQATVILKQIERGLENGNRYSAAHNAKGEQAAWGVIQALHPSRCEKQCKAMIAEWVKAGRFGIGEYKDDNRRLRTGILSVKTAVTTFE